MVPCRKKVMPKRTTGLSAGAAKVLQQAVGWDQESVALVASQVLDPVALPALVLMGLRLLAVSLDPEV